MTKIEYRGNEQNESLNLIKEMVKNAVKIFVDALPGMDEHMSFKSFTIPARESEEEMQSILDVLMTAIAIELKEQLGDDLEKYGFKANTEKDDAGDVKIWLHAKKGAYEIEKEELSVVEESDKE